MVAKSSIFQDFPWFAGKKQLFFRDFQVFFSFAVIFHYFPGSSYPGLPKQAGVHKWRQWLEIYLLFEWDKPSVDVWFWKYCKTLSYQWRFTIYQKLQTKSFAIFCTLLGCNTIFSIFLMKSKLLTSRTKKRIKISSPKFLKCLKTIPWRS